jgi:hypothetical protein
VLESQNTPKINLKNTEIKTTKSLQANSGMKILPAEKGNCAVVLSSSQCNGKIDSLF